MNILNYKIAYFGGEPLGVPVLNELKKTGILPSLILCNPDRPVGRKHILTPPPVKQWAIEHAVEVSQPENIKDAAFQQQMAEISWDLFIVVAYNKIMPKWLIDLPVHGTINLHPSLLPLLRGASPIRSSILYDMHKQCGVTIMQMDEKMDHGPIIAQETVEISKTNWPVYGNDLDSKLAQLGGELLAQTIPVWISGNITPHDQHHEEATYCGRLDRSMGELIIDPYNLPDGDQAYQILLKIRAFDGFPGTFFIHERTRIKIVEASIVDHALHIKKIIPEGKKEMNFGSYFTH